MSNATWHFASIQSHANETSGLKWKRFGTIAAAVVCHIILFQAAQDTFFLSCNSSRIEKRVIWSS